MDIYSILTKADLHTLHFDWIQAEKRGNSSISLCFPWVIWIYLRRLGTFNINNLCFLLSQPSWLLKMRKKSYFKVVLAWFLGWNMFLYLLADYISSLSYFFHILFLFFHCIVFLFLMYFDYKYFDSCVCWKLFS